MEKNVVVHGVLLVVEMIWMSFIIGHSLLVMGASFIDVGFGSFIACLMCWSSFWIWKISRDERKPARNL